MLQLWYRLDYVQKELKVDDIVQLEQDVVELYWFMEMN